VPALSVLLPVRDAGPYLAPSLASLWRQTFTDFEVVAVDDGSSDASGEMLEHAATHEPRLVVLRQPARGLPSALNLAFAHARAPVLVRHDADDRSHPCRFELQRAFLRVHRDVGVLGTRVRLFPSSAVGVGMRRWARWHNQLLTHEQIAAEALIDSPLAHGTAMLNRIALERVNGWAERGWPEDLDLWVRLLEAGVRFAKLPGALYAWRQHARSATRCQPRYRPERFDALRLETLARGLLRERPALTLVGVGASLARWRALLSANGYQVIPLAQGHPPPEPPTCAPPIVLVFGAAAARARWRVAFARAHRVEGREFCFVA